MSSSPHHDRKKHQAMRPAFDADALFPDDMPTTCHTAWSRIRCIVRLCVFILWAAIVYIIQGTCSLLPGSAHIRFPRFFWKVTCRIMGLKIRVIGTPAGRINTRQDLENGHRPVVFVANHCSWLDILVLGNLLPAIFVAKQEVRRWPLIGPLSHVARSIYIKRNRQGAGDEVNTVIERLRQGYNIVLFPEGTTSDGNRLLPFFSSILAIAKPLRPRGNTTQDAGNRQDVPPPLLVQPVTLVYDQLEGLPVGRSRRLSVFSWVGDMSLLPHLWAYGQWRSSRVSVIFHDPLDPDDFASRKLLTRHARNTISKGHEDLRQNRIAD